MQLSNTKKNHYVPKFYLKNFTDENENIYLFDKKTKKFHSTKDLRSIAFKTNLYTITNKISQYDISFFCKFLKISIDNEDKKIFVDTLTFFLNDELSKLFKTHFKDNNFNELICKILDGKNVSRNQELLFSLYEKDFMSILTCIIECNEMIESKNNKSSIFTYISGKIMFFVLKTIEKKLIQNYKLFEPNIIKQKMSIKKLEKYYQNLHYDLLHYILIQYFRILRIIDIEKKLKSAEIPFDENISTKNVIFLFIHYQILNIAEKLIHENYKIILLKNYTEKLFFTSDVPSINTHGEFIKDFGVKGIGYEIFFPLSPKLALLVTNAPTMFPNYNKEKSKIIIDKEEEMYCWNKFLFNNLERYMYGSCQEELKAFIDKVCKYY